MKCERLFLVIFLVLMFLFTTFGFEAKAGSALIELEKRGINITKAVSPSVQEGRY